eukprot:15473767-Alexandrium_andersonii.AAC.1
MEEAAASCGRDRRQSATLRFQRCVLGAPRFARGPRRPELQLKASRRKRGPFSMLANVLFRAVVV